MNDLRDPVAYRIAIGALGFAVATLLGGIAWVATVHKSGHVPVELWFAAAILGGLFVGVLIPFPHARSSNWVWAGALFLAVVGATVPAFGFAENFLPLCALAVASAGVLLGLLIPSPVERMGRHRC